MGYMFRLEQAFIRPVTGALKQNKTEAGVDILMIKF
jgi:hypothetical protein